MSFNTASNAGSSFGRRISRNLENVMDASSTAHDRSIMNVRADMQQRYGAMQMMDVYPNQYAMFGSWANSSTTVAP
jgi:hypothetical protein